MIKSFISGHFNVLHSGHLRLFKFAKNRSDRLIVGIYEKPLEKNKYIEIVSRYISNPVTTFK